MKQTPIELCFRNNIISKIWAVIDKQAFHKHKTINGVCGVMFTARNGVFAFMNLGAVTFMYSPQDFC
jgi:hypothetical protein